MLEGEGDAAIGATKTEGEEEDEEPESERRSLSALSSPGVTAPPPAWPGMASTSAAEVEDP